LRIEIQAKTGPGAAVISRRHESGVRLDGRHAAGKGGPAKRARDQAALDDLWSARAQITAARMVDGGDIITAGGVTSGLDPALWLVERFFGPEIAQKVLKGMEYERRGPVWTRKLAQLNQT
jgi:hypothetical protein